MKKYLLAASAAVSLCSAPLLDVDGTVNFTGKILASGCTLSSSGSQTQAVALPEISKNAFVAADSTASEKPFTLTFTGCPSNQQAKITMKSANIVSGKPTVLANTAASGATNVGIIVENTGSGGTTGGSKVEFNKFADAGSFTIGTSETGFSANYIARYYALTATPGVGAVAATVTLEVSY